MIKSWLSAIKKMLEDMTWEMEGSGRRARCRALEGQASQYTQPCLGMSESQNLLASKKEREEMLQSGQQ